MHFSVDVGFGCIHCLIFQIGLTIYKQSTVEHFIKQLLPSLVLIIAPNAIILSGTVWYLFKLVGTYRYFFYYVNYYLVIFLVKIRNPVAAQQTLSRVNIFFLNKSFYILGTRMCGLNIDNVLFLFKLWSDIFFFIIL